MLSGSVAMSIYIIPRATRDFDFVVHLQPRDIDAFVAYFNQGYYCDRDAVEAAIKEFSIINIIDHASDFKADFVIVKNEPSIEPNLTGAGKLISMACLYLLLQLKTFYYRSIFECKRYKAICKGRI